MRPGTSRESGTATPDLARILKDLQQRAARFALMDQSAGEAGTAVRRELDHLLSAGTDWSRHEVPPWEVTCLAIGGLPPDTPASACIEDELRALSTLLRPRRPGGMDGAGTGRQLPPTHQRPKSCTGRGAASHRRTRVPFREDSPPDRRAPPPAPAPSEFPCAAICGPPGSGKSLLAAEYVRRFGGDYRDVLWLDARDEERWIASLAREAWRLDRDASAEIDLERAAGTTRVWLSAHGGWLLVLDGLNRFAVFSQDPLSACTSGTVLVTTRTTGPITIGGRTFRQLGLPSAAAEAAVQPPARNRLAAPAAERCPRTAGAPQGAVAAPTGEHDQLGGVLPDPIRGRFCRAWEQAIAHQPDAELPLRLAGLCCGEWFHRGLLELIGPLPEAELALFAGAVGSEFLRLCWPEGEPLPVEPAPERDDLARTAGVRVLLRGFPKPGDFELWTVGLSLLPVTTRLLSLTPPTADAPPEAAQLAHRAGIVAATAGRLAVAQTLLAGAARFEIARCGLDSLAVAEALHTLAGILLARGLTSEAGRMLERALALFDRHAGPQSAAAHEARCDLASLRGSPDQGP